VGATLHVAQIMRIYRMWTDQWPPADAKHRATFRIEQVVLDQEKICR
jgi:hypothetical protein